MEMKPTFEQLYEQYYTPILRYIVKRISSYQDADTGTTRDSTPPRLPRRHGCI